MVLYKVGPSKVTGSCCHCNREMFTLLCYSQLFPFETIQNPVVCATSCSCYYLGLERFRGTRAALNVRCGPDLQFIVYYSAFSRRHALTLHGRSVLSLSSTEFITSFLLVYIVFIFLNIKLRELIDVAKLERRLHTLSEIPREA